MSCSEVRVLAPRVLAPQVKSQEQDWKSLTTFRADTTLREKMGRVAYAVLFGTALCCACAHFVWPAVAIASVGAILVVRKIVSVVIGYIVCPAALTSFSRERKRSLREEGDRQIEVLRENGYLAKRISLYKSGTRYSAVMIGHSTTVDNGRWTVNGLGNMMTMETDIYRIAKDNFENKSNTLLIDGPSVCGSGGWPTRYQMGAGFEAGLQFLERKVKATHVVMRGLSLGGGMIAEAICNHDFTKGRAGGTRYLSISDRTFSRLSSVAADFVGRIVKPIIRVVGADLDGIRAAKKLSDLNIRHIVIQHTAFDKDISDESDGVISDRVGLAHGLREENVLGDKVFLETDTICHNYPLPNGVEERVSGEITQFFRT